MNYRNDQRAVRVLTYIVVLAAVAFAVMLLSA